MAFDKIVGVDGTTYQFPSLVRSRIADNIGTVGSVENLATIDALGPALADKADATHTHVPSDITGLTVDSLEGVEIGVVGPNGIALADKQTLQYESATSTWRNKLAQGGVTVKDSSPPSSPVAGDAWFDSSDGSLYVYYDDTVGSPSKQWIQVQSNSALEGSILARLGAVESETTALETASPRTVADATARDSLVPSPVQGNSVFRTDTGRTETYHGLFNSSTNTGGRDSAGWYSIPETTGLVPVRPTSVAVASGSATVGAVGLVTFTGVTRISLNGCFTSEFTNYRFIYSQNSGSSTATDLIMRFRTSGTDFNNSVNYYYGGSGADNASFVGFAATPQSNGYIYVGPIHNSASNTHQGLTMDVHKPYIQTAKTLTATAYGWNGSLMVQRNIAGFVNNNVDLFDGFSLMALNGTTTFGGTIMVYGYNEK